MRQLIARDIPVNESILFQTDSMFFKELVNNINVLREENKEVLTDSPIATLISSVIKHHTGLNVIIDIGIHQPRVEIPMINKNNILINSVIRNHLDSSYGLKMINESKEVVRGSVNLMTGKVTGIFTEILSKIYLSKEMFENKKFTSEEIAAITLHEVGHLFTYYEYMTRMVTTNQVLSGLSKAMDNSSSVHERETVLLSVKKAMNLKDLDVEKLTKSKNNTVTEIVVITNITKETVSELGSNIYDYSTWEYLADQYAARQGAGRPLATGLEKVFKGHFNISFRSLPTYLAIEALKSLLLFISPQFAIIMMSFDSDNQHYDTPEHRIKRIRDQVVENLKDKKLEADDIDRLNADLVVIDNVLENANDRRQWFGVLWDTVNPYERKGRDQELLQKELEDLAVNEFYVKSSQLTQLV